MFRTLNTLVKEHVLCPRYFSCNSLKFTKENGQTFEKVARKSVQNVSVRDSSVNRSFVSPGEDLVELDGKYVPDWSLETPKRKFINKKKTLHYEAKGEMLFGFHPVFLALQNQRRDFYTLFLKQMEYPSERLKGIEELAKEKQIPLRYVDGATLDQICKRPVHQGVAADVSNLKTKKYDDVTPVSASEFQNNNDPLWLVLTRVHDPMNFGSILRCAYYFGVQRIFRSHSNCCDLTPFVSKASAGAMELMDIYTVDDLTTFLQDHQNHGWQIVGTCCSRSATATDSLGSFQLSKPTILLFGNEGSGLDTDLSKLCNNLIFVPALRELHPDVDSLNVSVAAGVILFQLLGRTNVKS